MTDMSASSASSYDGSLARAVELMCDVCDTLRLGAETVGLDENALGRVAAETVHAPAPLPAHPIALRDGRAVAAAAFAATPTLSEWPSVATRAPLPAGTDCVVPEEWSAATAASRVRPGLFVGACGSLMARGAVLLAAGSRVTPGTLALLRQALPPDVAGISVARAPRLALLTVCDDADTVAPGAAALVAAVLARTGLDVRTVDCGTAPATRDAHAALHAALVRALATGADGLVCLGGAWGAAPVLHTLAALGPDTVWTEAFRHTRLGPGKPTTFGTLRLPHAKTTEFRTVPVWVLGSSAEAAECGAYAAVVPGVEAMLGVVPARVPFGASTRVAHLRLAAGVHCTGKGAADDAAWVQLVPVAASLREGVVTRVLARRGADEGAGARDSTDGALVVAAHKSGLLVIPVGVTAYGPGDDVTVILTD